MANPNSLSTRIRFYLARWLDPYPDRGEAWCMECALNEGRTLILNADGHADHVERHREASGKKFTGISIRANYGHIPQEEE